MFPDIQGLLAFLQQHHGLYVGVVLVLGLLVGSFLNVVIFRYPRMLQREWVNNAREILEEQSCTITCPETDKEQNTFNLVVPASHCPACGHRIRPWENIPLLSWLFLRGRCSQCGTAISVRYPLVELLTGLTFAVVAWYIPPSAQLLMTLLATGLLIALTGIDMDHQLLPDLPVYLLLWTGLLGAALHWLPLDLATAVWGAATGYVSLWGIYWMFKLVTGKEGMGYGDFKLFAALGAWLGPSMLFPVLMVASVLGALVGTLGMWLFKGSNRIPFGPYLALSGWLLLFWGDELVHIYLRWIGLA
jgi:leader peptidase (prepilin peptidase)/N-methyltransferase